MKFKIIIASNVISHVRPHALSNGSITEVEIFELYFCDTAIKTTDLTNLLKSVIWALWDRNGVWLWQFF